MEFEHVTFDLPHGTFHALQGGNPDGQPTIVLHGFPDHPPTAKPFLAELGRRGRHVVAPWLRGYAPSPTAGPFGFAALTSDVLALIDRWNSLIPRTRRRQFSRMSRGGLAAETSTQLGRQTAQKFHGRYEQTNFLLRLDEQITSDYPKACQALLAKIFRLTRRGWARNCC
jgi:hypothetical protein